MTIKGCGCPKKKVFKDEIAAKMALANIWHRDRATANEKRAYRCPHKPWLWHLTSYEGAGPR